MIDGNLATIKNTRDLIQYPLLSSVDAAVSIGSELYIFKVTIEHVMYKCPSPLSVLLMVCLLPSKPHSELSIFKVTI